MTIQTWQERYREMQDNGVHFECSLSKNDRWSTSDIEEGKTGWFFSDAEYNYRIAEKQSIEGRKYLDNMNKPEESKKPLIPHIAERRLWLDQMEAGEPVEWQENHASYYKPFIFKAGLQPPWHEGYTYKPKPKTKKMYFALARGYRGGYFPVSDNNKDSLLAYVKAVNCIIIGEIEEREVEV